MAAESGDGDFRRRELPYKATGTSVRTASQRSLLLPFVKARLDFDAHLNPKSPSRRQAQRLSSRLLTEIQDIAHLWAFGLFVIDRCFDVLIVRASRTKVATDEHEGMKSRTEQVQDLLEGCDDPS